ncbi:C-type lectin domain family 4 member A-like [Pempheris klunzingeri]|uniref:C-type lectin domain family 4 member A-like n=1 Tax=Pempheris klunzingeri TaxID=3127111 RepID=UPI0039812B3C
MHEDGGQRAERLADRSIYQSVDVPKNGDISVSLEHSRLNSLYKELQIRYDNLSTEQQISRCHHQRNHTDVSAKADSSKVTYKRKEQEDEAEWLEREVDIYESAEAAREDPTESRGGGPHTENPPPAVRRRPLNAAALSVGVLCSVVLTGIILLSTFYISVTLEKDQLQTKHDALRNNYSRLQGQTSGLAVSSSQLQSRYQTLSQSHSQLQDEVKQLRSRIREKWCPEGWRRFGSSCYFTSDEKKTWFDSRKNCWDKGANLVVINTKEEQNLVTKLSSTGDHWIGLWQRTRSVWEWVDKTPLTERFWAAGLPHGNQEKHAACCDRRGRWTQSKHRDSKKWICEK